MTNMKILKKRRVKPVVGDVFVFQIIDDCFHWGQVVSITADVGGFENCILIYIYSTSTHNDVDIPKFKLSELLIPPVATNELPWKKGYFKFVVNKELLPNGLLDVHCFNDVVFRKYFDDKGNELDERSEPCGTYGLDSYASIDDLVSEALGIEVAPE